MVTMNYEQEGFKVNGTPQPEHAGEGNLEFQMRLPTESLEYARPRNADTGKFVHPIIHTRAVSRSWRGSRPFCMAGVLMQGATK